MSSNEVTAQENAKPLPKMQYARLGTSGLRVSRIILGGMAFGFTARVGQLAIQKRNIYDSASLPLLRHGIHQG